jgi:hypothetical protein
VFPDIENCHKYCNFEFISHDSSKGYSKDIANGEKVHLDSPSALDQVNPSALVEEEWVGESLPPNRRPRSIYRGYATSLCRSNSGCITL